MADQVHAYDVLVVGAGNAGLCAAQAAHEAGVTVGILEKAPRAERGGNSALTGHMRFPYSSADEIAPLMNDPDPVVLDRIRERAPKRDQGDLWDEIMLVTNGESDPDLLQVHVGEGYSTIKWLRSKGHDWVATFEATTGNIVTMNGGGYGLQMRHFANVEHAGIPVHYQTAMRELLTDGQGRVTGVQAITPQGYATFHARSVVLSCGGFESNAEMRARYLGHRWDTVRLRGVPFNTGDGLQAALEIGAVPYGSWSSCHASPQDIELPAFSMPSSVAVGRRAWTRYAYPYGIMVNSNGHRFVDEADEIRALTYAKMGRSILAQPGGIAFQIFDRKARDMGLLDSYDKANATGTRANTLEGLAGELGIDPAGLTRTVNEFNAAIQPGTLAPDPFRKDGKHTEGLKPNKSNFAISLDEGPFEGYAVRCGMTFTFGGLQVDPKTAQVQHVGGWALPGLYTCGEMLGGLWHWSYASGSGMMAGATFGRIAGTNAARTARGE
jgi:tricarballylate dehydrogenase